MYTTATGNYTNRRKNKTKHAQQTLDMLFKTSANPEVGAAAALPMTPLQPVATPANHT